MAAVTVAAQKAEARLNPAFGTKSQRVSGLKHQRIGLITVTSSADTLDLTTAPTIVQVAWEPVNTTDPIAATHSAGTITFTGTAGSTGYLHVWSNG